MIKMMKQNKVNQFLKDLLVRIVQIIFILINKLKILLIKQKLIDIKVFIQMILHYFIHQFQKNLYYYQYFIQPLAPKTKPLIQKPFCAYGNGNTKPDVDEHYLQTHNVNCVPPEVYSHADLTAQKKRRRRRIQSI